MKAFQTLILGWNCPDLSFQANIKSNKPIRNFKSPTGDSTQTWAFLGKLVQVNQRWESKFRNGSNFEFFFSKWLSACKKS